MRVEIVLDASVAAKCFFPETNTTLAVDLIASGVWVVAPDLIFAEMASIAAKRVRRDGFDRELARRAVEKVDMLLHEIFPMAPLRERAFDLAMLHGISAYDGSYLALAEMRGSRLVTADIRLARSARQAGLGSLLTVLGEVAP
ncbi:MAG: type II toxin-antitoxin system VapC family toxin [Alphaproteobacteria bacterium]|nr:type II toxin-antitoxin system VapC family toxin [Alphaproteobacteria bacterium]